VSSIRLRTWAWEGDKDKDKDVGGGRWQGEGLRAITNISLCAWQRIMCVCSKYIYIFIYVGAAECVYPYVSGVVRFGLHGKEPTTHTYGG